MDIASNTRWGYAIIKNNTKSPILPTLMTSKWVQKKIIRALKTGLKL
jgi:hypothetical protein